MIQTIVLIRIVILFIPLISFSQTWNETQILNSPQAIYNHEFGANVRIDGEYGIIKAKDYAYLMKHDGSQWSITQTVTASLVNYPNSGQPVDIQGARAVIGFTSMAYVYELDETNGTWYIEDTFEASSDYQDFGYAVAINEDLIAIGAPKESINEYQEGTVSIYQHTGDSWEFMQKITATDTTRDSHFGKSVVIEGTSLYVGAPYKDDSNGAVYHFELNSETNEWVQCY